MPTHRTEATLIEWPAAALAWGVGVAAVASAAWLLVVACGVGPTADGLVEAPGSEGSEDADGVDGPEGAGVAEGLG